MGRGGRAGRPPRGGRAIRSASRKVFHSNRSHSCRIHRCNCECGDYTFCITYGLRPKESAQLRRAGRSGAGLGLALALRSRFWWCGVASWHLTARARVRLRGTHARPWLHTRRPGHETTATIDGDGGRRQAMAGDGRRRHRWSRLWGEQEVRGAVPRAGLGLAPLPRGDSEAVHEPCKSRRPSARRRTCPDGRWSNAEWPG